jgi:hypothetical protein
MLMNKTKWNKFQVALTEVFFIRICILCSTVRGRIDQVNQVLELDKQSVCAARYNALDKWTSQLATLHLAVINKMA